MFVVRQNNRGRRLAVWAVTLVLAWLAAPVSYAQTGALPLDSYLHGSGGTTNPPTLTLDLLPSISLTAKTKDSSALNFSGGNPWQVLGSWIPPSGSSGAFTITAVGPTHVWTGLKASGDVGGKIDLLTEVLVNGSVISSGLTRCISNLTASSSTPVDVSVALGTIPVTSINPATQTLVVRVSARMGTTATNTACGTKTSVTGVRLYFDALTRLSRVNVTFQTPPVSPVALIPNPFSIKAGTTANLIAILFPVPLQATSLAVTSTSPAVATVPATLPVAAGQLFVSVPVTGVSAGATQVRVTLNGKSAYSTVKVTGGVATVTSLTPPSLSITQGGTGTLTVTLNAVQSTNQTVSLTSSATSIASVPASVSVPAGQLSAPVAVAANTAGQADITASLNGSSATSHITVTPALPTVVAVQPAMSQVVLGASSTLTVTISSAQVSSTIVTLTASPSGILTLPTTVLVPANQTQATFSVTGLALGTAMVTASLNSSSATAAVDVIPPALQLTALQPPTQSIIVGATGSLTVSINALQTTPTDIALTVDNPALLTIPPTVTVQPNALTATFTVIGKATGLATITTTLGTITKTATVTVTPQPPQVTALVPSTLDVIQGATGSLTLSINAAQVSDTTVPLTTSSATILDVPASVIVPSGLTSVTIPVAGLTLGTATVTATLNGTVTSTVTVVQPPALVTALGPVPPVTAPLTLAKGRVGILQVTISRVPTAPTVVNLTNAHTNLVTIPATVTVQAGQLTAEFPVTTQNEGTASITASLNGSSQSAQVVVTAPEIDALSLSPLAPSLFAGEAISFVATATMTDGTTQTITSNLAWTSGTSAVATIDNTGLATTLTTGTTLIKAATTNSLGPVTAETTLTVQPAPALAVAPVSGTLAVGQSVNLVVTSAVPAGPNGLVVNLAQAGTGSVTMVPTTIIPANGTTNSVVVTGASFGQVTITASAIGRIPATATFTITPAAPTIATVTPSTGTIGTVVTITGTNLNGSGPGSTTVKFNTANAIITTVTATTLTTTVPQGATTGLITVTTPGGIATSATPFTVTTSQDFSLTAAPVQVTVVRGQPITAQIQVTNLSANPVTGFVSLAATGLPTGMSGTFTPTQIAGGQVATLTLNSGTAPTGPSTLTISATAVIGGQTIVRQSPLQVTVLAAGTTTLAGRILATKDDAPIPGAQVHIGALTATADASGNFLFTNAPTGQQVLLVDGPSALYPGSLPVQMTIQAGLANVLPYPVFLHEVGQNYVPIAQGGQTIVAPPDIPGFSMLIPAGTTITGWDGQPNVKVSVVPVPNDRLPIPQLPANVPAKQVYMFNFGKPGGGYPSRPIPIIMPNDTNSPPGTRMDMWYYDEGPIPDTNSHQWKVYGQGTVSADGLSVVPDPGVGQPKFCCGGGSTAPGIIGRISGAALNFFDWVFGADPVMLQTGMFTLDQTDLVLSGRIPVVIRRAYHSQDPGDPTALPEPIPPARELVNSNAFGFNTTLMDYDDRLQGDGSGQTLNYTSGFRRERLTLQTDGTYRSTRTPMLFGMVGRANQDGTTTLRDKNGTVRTFGSDGWVRNITDRNGNTVTIVRSGGQIQQIIEPGGRALTFQYSGGGISQITDPLGRTVTYTYEFEPTKWGNPRLKTVINPAGGVTTYSYGFAFNIATITDARGITYLTNTYCSASCPLDPAVATQTLADGSVTRFDYLSVNQTVMQTTVTDGRGNTTVHRFNSRGHAIAVVDGLGQQTRMTRDFVTNQVMEVRDPLNRLTKYTYDAVGNVTSVLDPQGNPTIFEYESTYNRLTKITDALNQITRFTYNQANGDLLTVTDPLNQTTTVAYNAVGQPTSVTDPLTNTTGFEYDAVGNLAASVDPVGNKTQRVYDAMSRLSALTDPRGKSTQFTYDSLNQVTQITDALNGATAFAYDPNGNLLTLSDAKTQTTTYTYDNMDRLLTRKDALNRTESYQYDLASNLTRLTDRKNQIANVQYDPLDRRILTSYQDGTSVAVAYDAVGNVTKVTDSASGVIDWVYDALDRVTQEVTPQGVVSYTYDVLSRRLTMRANAQQPVIYSYDANSQLSQVVQGTLSGLLTHDALGRRTQLQRSNGVATTYNYDPASRLLGLTHAKGVTVLEQLTHGFDQADNKTQVAQTVNTATALPPAVSAAYNAVNAQTQFNGTTSQTLGYDPNGNLATTTEPAGATTYTWDSRDRLTGITGPSLTASFQYDALDRRISKTINGVTSTYQYDGADLLTETGPTQASYLSSLNIDEPLVRQTPSGNEFYLANDLGSTLALTNDSGAVTTSYTYGPFGTTTVNGTSTNPVQFTGRENDGTGLYYYRARYYNPSHGRFLAEDPLEFDAGDSNLYAYVFNNPTNFTDPFGARITIPPEAKRCLAGLIIGVAKSAGANLALRKPGVDPASLLDAAQGCVGGGGASAGKQAAKSPQGANNPKVKSALQKGQAAHQNQQYPPGYQKEVELPSGKRMDAYNPDTKHIIELKPNNPDAIRKGKKQLEGYCAECNEVFGPGHTGTIQTYK